MKKMSGESKNLIDNNIDLVKKIFPEAITGNKIDFDKLRLVLGDDIDTSNEKYNFTWPGKFEAIKLAQAPSTKTLRPIKNESKNWDFTENLFLEGDNLEVLKQLQKTYHNKVNVIYIDPPYNTGKDFLYNDKFAQTTKDYKEILDMDLISNPDTSGKYHSNWLNMMYPRLLISRNLLSEDGVIFVSIDNNEYSNLKKILDEIYGESNYLGTIIWNKKNAQNDAYNIQSNHEYILAYAKKNSRDLLFNTNVVLESLKHDEHGYYYDGYGLTTGGEGGTLNSRPNLGSTLYYRETDNDLIIKTDYDTNLARTSNDENKVYKDDKILISNGYVKVRPPSKGNKLGAWTWSKDKMEELKHEILVTNSSRGYSVKRKIYVDSKNVVYVEGKSMFEKKSERAINSVIEYSSSEGTRILNTLFGSRVFSNSKPVGLLKEIFGYYNKNDALIMDFFSGSSSTAQAILELNKEDNGKRKFIMVQLPEKINEKDKNYDGEFRTIADIGKERIRRVGDNLYSLNSKTDERDSLENLRLADIGFKVFKLDDTNINLWDSSIMKSNEETLFSVLEDVFKHDRSKLDISYEIILKYGVFDQTLKEVFINGKEMFDVGEGYMLISLGEDINLEDVKEIGQLGYAHVIFNDKGFLDDNVKLNAEYTLKNMGVEEVVSI